MSEQYHRIFRLSFDLSIPEEEAPAPIQDRMSKLINHALIPLMDQLFSTHCQPSKKISAQRLEIDLGNIPLDDLENIIPGRLENELQKELLRLLQLNDNQFIKPNKEVYQGELIEALGFFLVKGAFPWWFIPEANQSPGNLLVHLARQKPKELILELYRISHLENVPKRIALTLTDAELAILLRTLEPVNYPFVQRFSADLETLHKKKPVLNASQNELRIAKWELILQHFLQRRGSVFNQQRFVGQILANLARHYNVTYYHLLENLYLIVKRTKTNTQQSDSLQAIVLTLWSEFKEDSSTTLFDHALAPEWQLKLLAGIPIEHQEAITRVFPFFEKENIDLPPFQTIGAKIWEMLVRRLWRIYPKKLLKLTRRLTQTQKVSSPYLLHFPGDVIHQALEAYYSDLYLSINKLSSDILSLSAMGIFPGWKQSELLKKAIEQDYLKLFIGSKGKKHTPYSFFRHLFSSLSSKQKSGLPDWLQALFTGISTKNNLPVIGSPLFEYMEKLAIETQVSNAQLEVFRQFIKKQSPNAVSLIDSQTNNTNKQQQSLLAEIEAILYFFKTGNLLPGSHLDALGSGLLSWKKNAPDGLKTWLQQHIPQEEFIERLTFYFPQNISRELLNTLAPPSGTIAADLLKIMQSEKFQETLPKLSHHTYWGLVWKMINHDPSSVLSPTSFIYSLIQQLAAPTGLSPKLLIDKLSEAEPSQKANSAKLLRAIATALSLGHELPSDLLSQQNNLSEIAGVSPEQIWLEIKKTSHLSPEDQLKMPVILWRWMELNTQADKMAAWKKIVKREDILRSLSGLADDRTVTGLMTQINPAQTPQWIDLAVVLKEAQYQSGRPFHRLFPEQLGFLFLKGLLVNRGSLSNQKNYIKKLLQDWAQANGMAFDVLLKTLWPLVQALGPGFQHHSSFQLFSQVISENLGSEVLMPVKSTSSQKTSKNKGQKPYRKLWEKEEELPFDPDEVFIVHNAGAIILWPYLGLLFERAGLMVDGVFQNDESRQKAIYLLEYLISGKAVKEEYQLTLNKVLCDYPLNSPLNPDFLPDDSLKALCTGLLQAVIQYWSVLGDTTPEGLREAFLLREGTLSRSDKRWRLQVNPTSYDILLNQLPWSIAVVNLSWLGETIEVKWI